MGFAVVRVDKFIMVLTSFAKYLKMFKRKQGV